MTWIQDLVLATSSALAFISTSMMFFCQSKSRRARNRLQRLLHGKIPSDCCQILEDVVSLQNEGIWLFDRVGRTVSMNATLETMLAIEAAAAQGKRLSDFIDFAALDAADQSCHGQCLQRFQALFEPIVNGADWGDAHFTLSAGVAEAALAAAPLCSPDDAGNNLRCELKLHSGDSKAVWVKILAVRHYDRRGRFAGVLTIVQNISQQRVLEAAHAAKERDLVLLSRRLELAINNLGIGIWELDLATGKLTWDRAMHEVYGFDSGSFDGNVDVWRSCLHPEDRENVDAAFARLLGGAFIAPFGFRILRHSDQKLRYLEANGIMQNDPQGRPMRVIGTNWDVTDRKIQELDLQRAKSEADSANKAKSQFLAHMSHEIRTPLSVIRGYAEILSQSQASSSPPSIPAAECITNILDSSAQLEVLVNDILDLSRVEAGKIVINEISFCLDELLEQILAIFLPKARCKGLELFVARNTVLPQEIQTDPQRLRQILLNLVGNAVKFTDSGKVEIVVSCDPIGNSMALQNLEIRVRDTGIGIEQSMVPQLFRPFSQLDSTSTRRHGGSGLGLWLSRNLAEILGGRVELESSNVGAGSTFVLKMKVKVPSSSSMHLAPAQSSASSAKALCDDKPLTNMKLLVADDAPELRLLLMNFLLQAGASVSLANDGKEAVEKALSDDFDAVIMDIQMPRIDGYSAMRILKEREYPKPVIALTAHAMTGERDKCLAAGFCDYVTKPVRFQQLIQAVLSSSDNTAKNLLD